MTALLVFLLSLPGLDWVALVVAVVLAAALVGWELRVENPFLDVRLLASNLALTRTYIRNGLTLLGTYVILYGLTQWMRGRPWRVGLRSRVDPASRWAPCRPSRPASSHAAQTIRRPLIASAILSLLGAVAVLFLTSSSPIVALVAVTALFGLMSGSSNVANQTALYTQAPARERRHRLRAAAHIRLRRLHRRRHDHRRRLQKRRRRHGPAPCVPDPDRDRDARPTHDGARPAPGRVRPGPRARTAPRARPPGRPLIRNQEANLKPGRPAKPA